MSSWHQSLAVSASFSLAVTAFAPPSALGQTSSQPEGGYQLAATQTNCRKVSTSGSNLNVRSSPNGRIIGSLSNGTTVTIENTGTNGWVPISAPQEGYVFGAFLSFCAEPPPPPDTPPTSSNNCRRVEADGGLRIRRNPSLNSPVIGVVPDGGTVTIVNRGKDGWAPISEPEEGYVSTDYLKLCDRAVEPPSPTSPNCRQVGAMNGLTVRESPSIDSDTVGSLDNSELVTIVNRGANGWVPISAPLTGYIQAASLKLCR
ncbi:MAG TPA: hypothetical protein DDZ80_09920 [Cyanobacteria bacterium UBA8803]|nr:hypothetical protein [Cyanobacteria bacterium UBA9273]HBL58809.1 hypothetical protein [Cyanobacteria bacterium UBA8803]